MHPRLRLAILECDTPIGRARTQYGGYGNLFKELLERAAEGQDVELDITKYDVVNQEVYPDLDKIDAVLLTGSKFNAFDNDPWILKLVGFVEEVLKEGRVRVVGVCFGHQIVGRALGVQVGRNERGWEVAVTEVELSERGKEVFKLERLAIHQMHRDIVFSHPPGVESLGSTETCEVQGMYKKGGFVTVQGHPEFYEGIMEDIINARHEAGVFDEGMWKESLKKAGRRHDGLEVARGFLRFLRE